MTSRAQPNDDAGPRLYLVTPQVTDPAVLREPLVAALDAADVAAVLLRLAPADERTLTNRVKALAPSIQDKGAALLLEEHADIAVRAGADGAHLTSLGAFNTALPQLKPARIAGCGGLVTRHDAMLAGEAGADYVMFGEPDAGGWRPSFATIIERLTWWAELFEIPCVGFAASADEIAAIAQTGVEFVALGDWIFHDPRGMATAIGEAAGRLERAETG